MLLAVVLVIRKLPYTGHYIYVVVASIAYIRGDTTDDIQYYRGFIHIIAIICNSAALSHDCDYYMS